MVFKNVLSACIGVWFIVTPWVFGFTDQANPFLICVVLGGLQVVCSLLAGAKSGSKVWQNWVCFVIGAIFILIPNLYQWHMMEFFLSVVLGFMTMLVNYSNLYSDCQ
ncbi:SPW repeat protein [Paenibacillus sp. SI8]|uniref:SPW repeat protein n=1 Tax=unclassified Paenibacillus TaxID=185978 RepID=UPI003467A5FF